MFHEYDVVKLKRDVPANPPNAWPDVPSTALAAGERGAVVMVYNDGEVSAYEVEFVAEDGSTLALLTLTDSDLAPAD